MGPRAGEVRDRRGLPLVPRHAREPQEGERNRGEGRRRPHGGGRRRGRVHAAEEGFEADVQAGGGQGER